MSDERPPEEPPRQARFTWSGATVAILIAASLVIWALVAGAFILHPGAALRVAGIVAVIVLALVWMKRR